MLINYKIPPYCVPIYYYFTLMIVKAWKYMFNTIRTPIDILYEYY